ncbi:MAG: nucleotidyl transferase [Candidatus Neomarinimicrobiota bacterium]|nr:MAG: nucleotidyl transferase [Candidatus Neomarinimicrobiota bacterium]
MKAVIPAAGIGERLRPLTLTRPKVLLPVAGKPILGHILDRIVESGIKDVTIVVGYMGNQVIKYVRNHYNLNFDFVEQKKRRGLGHAVLQGLDSSDEPVLILLGDTILDLNFYKFAQSRYNVIGVMTVEDPRRFGIVEVKDEWVTKLVEKPENPISKLAIAGVYLLQSQKRLKKAIEYIIENDITTKGEYQLTDALQVMLSWNERMKIEKVKACCDCGTRKTLFETNRYLLEKINYETRKYPNSVIIPPVYIHPKADIRKSVIGPYVSIGDGVTICDSVIEDSIINDGANLKNVCLKNSLLGFKSTIKGKYHIVDVRDNYARNL